MSLPVGIVGAGGFGQAIALAAARAGRSVILWSRHPRELPTPKVRTTTVLADLAEVELVFMAVPSLYVTEVARELGTHLDGSHLVVHVSRGLVGNELETLTELLRTHTPVRRVGALAGPLVAEGLAKGEPGGAIIGTIFPEVAEAVREAIAGPTLRIYSTDDVIGVEVASAFVGLAALAVGYAQAGGFGPATIGVLATRAMAEATRVGVRRGGEERTFAGLAGYGDLIAAVAGDGRPELLLGRALFYGASVDEASAEAGAFIEGIAIARRVVEFAQRYALEVPLSAAMSKLLQGGGSPAALVAELMTRPARHE